MMAAVESATVPAVPDSAKGPLIGDRGYLLQEIRDGLHLVTNGQYQSLLMTTNTGVVAFDAPPALAGVLPLAVAELGAGSVTHLVYSHAHGDHIGAAHVLAAEGLEVVASTRTAAILARFTDTDKRLTPTVVFDDHLTLEVGERVVSLDHRGANHSPDNLFIHFPAQRTVMLVDVILPGWVPFRALTVASDIPGFLRAHDQLLQYDFDTLVGGHLTRLGTREDVIDHLRYVDDVIESTAAALPTVSVQQIRTEIGSGNPFLIADTYNERVAAIVANGLVERWSSRLGGVAVFAHSHAIAAIDTLRYDYNIDGGGLPPQTKDAGDSRYE